MANAKKAPRREQYMTTGHGIKVTTKPRCYQCGQMMRAVYLRIKKSAKAPNKTYVRVANVWYCPNCDKVLHEPIKKKRR